MAEDIDEIEAMVRSAATAEGVDRDNLLAGLARLPEQQARSILERAAAEQGTAAVPLLEHLAARAKGALAVAAAQSLGTVRNPVAATALHGLAATTSGEVRKAARRGLHRLASLGVNPAREDAVPREPRRATWPVYKALSSPIDGVGNRGLWIGFQGGAEINLFGLLLSDERGIKEVFDTEMARSRFDRSVAGMLKDEAMPWVEMPVDYCRHLVEEAHARNAANRMPIPVEYLTWRDRLGRPEQTYEQPLVYSVISAAEVRWDPRHLDNCDRLYELRMFQSWGFTEEEMREFVREHAMAEQSGLVLAGASAETRGRMVVERAIHKLFDARRRVLLKRRLEEMAYHLWKLDMGHQARLAVAAALALEPPDRPLTDHPFARRMVEWSLRMATAELDEQRTRTVKPGVQLHLPY